MGLLLIGGVMGIGSIEILILCGLPLLGMNLIQIVSMTMLICIYKRQKGEEPSPIRVGFLTCLALFGVLLLISLICISIIAGRLIY